MQIVRLEPYLIAMPLRHPMRMAGRAITETETVIVKVITTGKTVGWGEANVAQQLTGVSRADTLTALARCDDALRGCDVRNVVRTIERAKEEAPQATPVWAALEMAFYDLIARDLGISVSRLLGGDQSLDVPYLALIDSSDPDAINECKRRLSEGASLLKIKVANGPVDQEVAFVNRVRADFGDRVKLAADANGGWTLSDAKSFCAGASKADILFLEQPLSPKQDADTLALSRETKIALGADESIHELSDIVRCAQAAGVQGISLKLLKVGGLAALRDAAAVATALKLAINVSGKVGETGLANAATLHMASTLEKTSWGVSLTGSYLSSDIVDQSIGVGGSAAVLAGPGLGVTVDERRLADLMRPYDPAPPARPVSGEVVRT